MSLRRFAIASAFCILLICGGQPVFGAGRPEDPIAKAEDLITEGRYNEAVVVLHDIIDTEPDRIDEAERLLRRIRAVRTDYNELFERLLNHLDESPEDLETTLSIIEDMERLEAHPNPQVRQQLQAARTIAQLAYDREMVIRILREAAGLLEERRYAEALERYQEGFEIRRGVFEERGFDAAFGERIASLREELIARTNDVITRVELVRAAVDEAQRYPDERSSESLVQTQRALSTALDEVVVLEEALAEAAGEAAAVRDEVADHFPDDPVDWHVNFLRILSVGSFEQRRYQGVLGATALMLDEAISEFRAPLEKVGRERISAGIDRLEEERFFEADARFLEAERDFETVVAAALRRSAGVAFDPDEAGVELEIGSPGTVIMPEDREALLELVGSVRAGVARYFLEAQLQREQARAFHEVARSFGMARSAVVVEPPEVEDPREVYEQRRLALLGGVQEFSGGRRATQQQRELAEGRAELLEAELAELRTAMSEEVVSATRTRLAEYVQRLRSSEAEALVALAELQYSDASGIFARVVEDYELAIGYLEGRELPPGFEAPGEVVAADPGQEPPPPAEMEPHDLPELELDEELTVPESPEPAEGELAEDDLLPEDDDVEALVLSYPAQAREVLEPLVPQLEQLRPRVRGYADYLSAAGEELRTEPGVELWMERTTELADILEAMSLQVAAALERSQDYLAQSMELRAEGEELLAQTEQAIADLDVERARELWEEARSRFYDALELQDDPQFREEIDRRIVALGVEIQEAQNQRIVQEVRQRIQTANQLYNEEEYMAAQEELLEARRLWELTNVTENAEIERLLGLVNAALNFEDERTLTEADPLFPVLSNYLSIAQDDFERGRELHQNDAVDESERFLDRAERNLENVIAVRPNNWEARLLQLRIIELREGENFDRVFDRRFEDVVAQRDAVDPMTTLTELEVLHEINPDYPGLEDMIVELEIELGIRPDPVTVAQEEQSNELLAQAQGIAGGGLGQDRAAMQLLEEALDLNPQNSEAQALLDELRIRTGGQATVALSSTAEQQYRRAEALFVQGNVAQAYSIVQNLMQDDANAAYPPLQRLHRRITSRLGI